MIIQQDPTDRILQRIGAFFFRWRNTIFPIIFLGMAVVVRPAKIGPGTLAPAAFVTLGILMVLAGQLVRGLTVGLVYIRRGGKDKQVYADTLVQTGVYAHTRNPMYLGNLLIAGGFCMLYGSPWMYACVFPFFWCVYQCITRAEELYLAARFGDAYLLYQRRVPRFWPRIEALAETLKVHTFDWYQLVLKEYGTLCATFLGLYVLTVLQLGLLPVAQGAMSSAMALISPIAICGVAYLVARFLKKSGRLCAPRHGRGETSGQTLRRMQRIWMP